MRKKIQFLKLFNRYGNYSTEIRFEVFRWMIATGWDFKGEDLYQTHGVFEQIWGLSCVNSQMFPSYYGFHDFSRYNEEIAVAFVRAIISADCLPCVEKWREKENIGIDSVRYLDLKISDMADRETKDELYALFIAAKEKKLTVQLNPCWSQAVDIYSVLLTPDKNEWRAILKYGFDGSSWPHILACQGKNTFYNFLKEACIELDRITKNGL